jgi:hypothetical protein
MAGKASGSLFQVVSSLFHEGKMLRQLNRNIERLSELVESLNGKVDAMAIKNQALVQAIQDLNSAVADHESKINEQIDAAVKARESDDQAAFDAATDQIRALTSGIVGHTSSMAQQITNQASGVDTTGTGAGGNALGTSQPASNTGLTADVSTSNQNAGGSQGTLGVGQDPASSDPNPQNRSNQQ